MTGQQESVLRTLLVAAVVALLCSLIVSTAVVLLRPYQLAYSRIDRNRAILEALEILAPQQDVPAREVVARFVDLERRIADLDSGSFTNAVDSENYDFRIAADDPATAISIPESEDVGGLMTRPQFMPIYLLDDGGERSRIAMPFYARGMWSTIYGYIALEADLQTIAGFAIYEHGETPGIGDRMLEAEWLNSWRGKRLYGAAGDVQLRVSANAQNTPAQYRVDSITGATVSVDAVGAAVRYWFSEHGYGRFLARLTEEGG